MENRTDRFEREQKHFKKQMQKKSAHKRNKTKRLIEREEDKLFLKYKTVN